MPVVGRFAALLFVLLLSFNAVAQTVPVDDDVNAAAAAFRNEQYPQAATLFRKVVTADPQNAAAWHFLGQSLEKNGDLIGAREAYRQAIATDTSGKVAERTRTMLDKLPLPDPTKIVLPSGLTLLDWMNLNAKTPSGTPADVLKESSGYIRTYGPFPQLIVMRDSALKTALATLDVNSADSARKALPLIEELRASVGDTPDLLSLSARAKHATGDFAAAKADYSRWLQIAPADSTKRPYMAENLLRAGRGELPTMQPVRPDLPQELPEEFWAQIEKLDLYRKAPKVRSVSVAYEEHQEEENVKKGEYIPTGVGASTTILKKELKSLDVPGCFVLDARLEYNGKPANSSGYMCGGGFIPVVSAEGWEFEYSGSIFPLTVGATMTIVTRRPNYVSTERYTVTGKVSASTLSPKLTGDAWELAEHLESSITVEGKVSKSVIDDTDLFIEDLGMLESKVGALIWTKPDKPGKPGKWTYVIPADGAVYHGVLGNNIRQSFSNTHFDLE